MEISPRVLCPCGKSILRMSAEQRQAYDDSDRRLAEAEEARSESQTKEALPPNTLCTDEPELLVKQSVVMRSML